jgi:hypothetical protein
MKTSRFKFPRRVRIHGGECGAVARALHHEAELFVLPAVSRKVFETTQERKVMSNKTFFKRIALTAIAALGFGMLSVTSSQATVSGHTLTIGATSTADTATYATSITAGETSTAVVAHSFLTSGQYDSVTVTALVTGSNSGQAGTLKLVLTDSSTSLGTGGASGANEPTYLGASGNVVENRRLVDSQNSNNITTYVVTDSSSARAGAAAVLNTTLSARLIAPSAGTFTVRIITEVAQLNGSGVREVVAGPSVTWTVTVAAQDATATSSSTSTLRKGESLLTTGTKEGTDSSVVASRTATSTNTDAAATIWINQKNAAGTANESMTVTVSGPAFVNTDSNARPTSGGAITIRNLGPLSASYSYSGLTPIFVWSTGTAGKATITVSTVSGLVLGTETVSFYGPVTSIVVDTTYAKVVRAGGFSTDTIDIYATDAAGMPVPGLSFGTVSSNTDAVASAALGSGCADYASALASDAYAGYYGCSATTPATSVSGAAATLTYRVVNPAVTTSTAYFTLDQAVKLGGSVSTVTLTADKATYEPGEKMILTATALDSSGNQVWDGATGPTGLIANKSLGGTVTMNKFYDGKSTSQVRSSLDPRNFTGGNDIYAPNASGKFTITYVYGTYSEKTATVTATVGDDGATAAANAASDAAAEAIDAANAATDAANLAAEAADAATVAAEEARDAADAATAAVEALATEVATLMAALKAQITTLANTVAKIAKKVKA